MTADDLAALRDATRVAHEVLRDLRTERRAVEQLIAGIEGRVQLALVRTWALARPEEGGRALPTDRSLVARIAANTRWSREDSAEQGRKMRAGLDARFLREVDPDGTLPDDERRRRADCARKAFFQRLALASAKARRERSKA